MNNLSMIGNISRDLELKYSNSGTAILNMNIAVQRAFKNKTTGEYESDFFNCTVFGKTAEIIAEYFHKGSKIGISGTLQNNNYEKSDGTKVYRDVIIVNGFDFIDSKNSKPDKKEEKPKNDFANFDEDPFEKNDDPIDISDDDLPF